MTGFARVLNTVNTDVRMILTNLLLSLLWRTFSVHSIDVAFETKLIHKVVNSKFVNIALSTGIIRENWGDFTPECTRIQTLAAGLSPSFLRIGGTQADFLIFRNDNVSRRKINGTLPNSTQNVCPNKTLNFIRAIESNWSNTGYLGLDAPYTNFTMTASFYDQIHKFASHVGWDVIFDLNSLLRNPTGAWDPSNAIELINYTAQSGYKMGGWELGNEPNAYYHHIGVRVEPEQLAKDFISLHKLLGQYSQFDGTQLLGPSVTQLNKKRTNEYFGRFLSSGGGKVVTAATFHQYYENGRKAQEADFYNPDILNLLYNEIQTGLKLVNTSGTSAKLWLGETSSAFGGGAPGLSDSYIAGFLWLDKLGMSARDGIDAVVRQTFYGGHYALLDEYTLEPNPDYWLTLLYKLLVGNRVLRVTSPDSSGQIRVYAHCTKTNRSGYPVGSVTLYIMNLGDSETRLTFSQLPGETVLHVYNMTPPGNDLLSKFVMLNGLILKMKNEKALPDLLRPVKTTSSVTVAAKTFSFIVIPDANASACA